MMGERIPDVPPGTRDDVQDTGREAGGRRELAEFQRGQGGERGGLEDDRVARRQGGRDPSRGEEERIIPRSDVYRHAEWFAQGVVESRAGYGNRIALNFIGKACIIFEQLVDVREVAFRLPERFPHVGGLEPRELLKVIAHLLSEEPQQPPTFARIKVPPLR